MGIAILDAGRLAQQNKLVHEGLVTRHETLQQRCEKETQAQDKARGTCHRRALTPFRDIFARIKNVDLVELASFDELPSGALPDADVQSVRLSATGAVGTFASGAAVGAAFGATTFAAVGAFANPR